MLIKRCHVYTLFLLLQAADGYLEIETPGSDQNMFIHFSELINTLESFVRV